MLVNPYIYYTSNQLFQTLKLLKNQFDFITISTIGFSILKKPIYLVKIGNGAKKLGYFASFHANESITTNLLVKFIEDLCLLYQDNDLLNNVTFFIVPLVNPDGVDLVNSNNPTLFSLAKPISKNFPEIPFPSGWKANIRGVDIKNFQHLFYYLS